MVMVREGLTDEEHAGMLSVFADAVELFQAIVQSVDNAVSDEPEDMTRTPVHPVPPFATGRVPVMPDDALTVTGKGLADVYGANDVTLPFVTKFPGTICSAVD